MQTTRVRKVRRRPMIKMRTKRAGLVLCIVRILPNRDRAKTCPDLRGAMCGVCDDVERQAFQGGAHLWGRSTRLVQSRSLRP